jgi:GntR family transcriptional repressor for pyruvate dehydrogenase complex
MFSPVPKTKKATTIIIDQVRLAILQSHLCPGDKLSSEKEMSENFKVSRQTVREALSALENMGLIEIRQGVSGGAYIRTMPLSMLQESFLNFLHFKDLSPKHLADVRQGIEPYAARLAASLRTEEDLAKLESILRDAEDAFDRGAPKHVVRGHEARFHLCIASITRNPALSLFISIISNILGSMRNMLQPDISYSSDVATAHRAVFEAIKNQDCDLAAECMLKDVRQAERVLGKLAEAFNRSPDDSLVSFGYFGDLNAQVSDREFSAFP